MNVNPAYRLHELKHALNLVELEGIIVLEQVKTSKYLEMLQKLVPEMEQIEPNSDVRIRSTEVRFGLGFSRSRSILVCGFCSRLKAHPCVVSELHVSFFHDGRDKQEPTECGVGVAH